jgi:hypothetical protein
MSEELYNSNDYCKLAEELEELKKENAELARDKDHLMNLFMESSEYVFNVVSNMKINDLGQKCKRLEADYEISNRELLVKQVEITALRAELEAAQRWRVVANGELPKNNDYYWAHDDLGQQGMILFYDGEWNKFTNLSYITHWMPLPQPPEERER